MAIALCESDYFFYYDIIIREKINRIFIILFLETYETKPGKGGEIQLTDELKELAKKNWCQSLKLLR
ncbi:hypothetical protein TZ02_09285 [Clostridium aceticum]|nr:hypothetical protein TZ02_09285 [Clostridium aceticum]